MPESFKLGQKVKIHLDSQTWRRQGWFEGRVVRIEPYSQHRSFYWVELDESAQALLGIKLISVFNPKNIQSV